MKRLLEEYECYKQMQFIAQKRGLVAGFCDVTVKADTVLKKIADLSSSHH